MVMAEQFEVGSKRGGICNMTVKSRVEGISGLVVMAGQFEVGSKRGGNL